MDQLLKTTNNPTQINIDFTVEYPSYEERRETDYIGMHFLENCNFISVPKLRLTNKIEIRIKIKTEKSQCPNFKPFENLVEVLRILIKIWALSLSDSYLHVSSDVSLYLRFCFVEKEVRMFNCIVAAPLSYNY